MAATADHRRSSAHTAASRFPGTAPVRTSMPGDVALDLPPATPLLVLNNPGGDAVVVSLETERLETHATGMTLDGAAHVPGT